MTQDQWSKIVHFTRNENWGEPDLMSFDVVSALDEFRDFLKNPIVVSCGTNKIHSPTSRHYPKNNPDGLGHAIDIIFPTFQARDLFDLFVAASRFPFTGIGCYTDWHYNGKAAAGMHLETAQVKQREYWLGVPSPTGTSYIAWTLENLKAYVPDLLVP